MNIKVSLFNCKSEKLESYSNKINGTIREAIQQYEYRNVPLNQLLSDYEAIINNLRNVKEAINPWEYYHKGIKNIQVVCGVSIAETLFNVSAMSLIKQKPMTVIKAIYYRNKLRNDSGIEKYFLDSFLENLQIEKKIGVINPSPYAIEYIEDARKGNHYLVIDQTMANLYSRQFKESTFVSLNEDKSIQEADVLIVFMSQAEDEALLRMMKIISESKATEIYGIMQNRLIDNKKSVLWEMLSRGYYAFRDIVIMPNQISNSSPKKKCFITMVKSDEKKGVIIQQAKYDDVNKEISIDDNKIIICQEELIKYSTIRKLCSHYGEVIPEDNKTISTYTTAQLYSFSKEIYMSYAIYADKRGYYGKAYYAAIKNTQIPEIRGKSLTARTEKGLRNRTKEEVVSAIENLPFENKIATAIVDDIQENFLNEQKAVTLKTLWFCLRQDLLKEYSYDDEFIIKIFSGRNQITDIYLGIASSNEIKRIIEEQFEIGEESQELRLLKMINLIVQIAIKKGYLAENRILPLLPLAEHRASKRQTEVRQALAKRSFEAIEEEKIIRFLKTKCKENSIYLAVVIRIFTGMQTREICGLKWEDFRYDVTTGVYKLAVTKFIDDSGKIVSHALKEKWEKYRVLPLGEILSRWILDRKKYLISLGLDEDVLLAYPIIMERDSIEHIRKGKKVKYCKPSVIAEKCKEVVLNAEIPEHIIILPEKDVELETDINKYGGDIFRTNFRDKVLNDAGFGLDELNYYLGIKKPDTFSQHYCDYTNEYVQLIMAKKLNRWMDKYTQNKNTHITNSDNQKELTTKGIHGGVPSVEVEVSNLHKTKEKIVTVDVESEHGFKVIVTGMKRGDD